MFGRKRIKYLEDKLEYAAQLLEDSEYEVKMYRIALKEIDPNKAEQSIKNIDSCCWWKNQ